MELRELAVRILSATTLEDKLTTPEQITDKAPGPKLLWQTPSRPIGMEFQRRTRQEKLPSFQELHDEEKRAVCLHRFAGHELLAVELMAYAILAFPEAPRTFRKGLLQTLKDEQEHVRLYMKRLEQMGVQFGDMPLYKHFWAHVPYLTDPIEYVSTLSLTFEMANLDFAPMYGASFAKVDDPLSAQLMGRIFDDEIRHVRFGFKWLQRLKKRHESDFEAWAKALSPALTPHRAKGFLFHEEHRKQAGVSDEWLEQFKLATEKKKR